MLKTLKILTSTCLLVLACSLTCLISACNNSSRRIVVGASSTPHALILEQTKTYIKEQGYELEIKVFNDYVLPN